jgi:arylsulfatase A-like enzyme/tetratricopeptide (TPR) repeat protein
MAGWYLYNSSASTEKIDRVLLISIDTCRADYLSCYGYPRKTTPNIDAVAEQGVLFENVISPIPTTLPAHSSVFTGTIPPYHGIHDNMNYRLNDSNVTLAEILKDNGFTTAGIISAFVLDSQFGIDQGFDYYNDDFVTTLNTTGVDERLADETSRFAIEWLDKHNDEKFFLFLHYYDPHFTYEPPEPFRSKFQTVSESGKNTLKYQQNLYAGEIAYADHCIGRVLDKLKTLRIYDSTLIIILGDHGEMLGEHAEVTHTFFIYQSAVKVPLIFKLPGKNTPRTTDQLAGLIDIVPTICSLLDIETPPQVQGMDLSACFDKNTAVYTDRELYCESLEATKYRANSLLGILTDRFKYIQTTRPELYDLAEDPTESDNLIDRQPQQGRILKDRLSRILELSVRSGVSAAKERPDTQTIKRLESLGYVAGVLDEDFSFDQTRDDPKDLIDFHMKNLDTSVLLEQKEYDQAIRLCKELIAQRPDAYLPYFRLASIAKQQDDYPKAIVYLKKAIELRPEDSQLHYYLGIAFLHEKQSEKAAEHFTESLRVNNYQPETHLRLAEVLYESEDYDRTIEHLTESLRLRPRQVAVLNKLADLYYKRGQFDRTIEYLTESLQIDPAQPVMLDQLATSYYTQGRTDTALMHWTEALELEPERINVLNALAWVKAVSSDDKYRNTKEALELARRACELAEYKKPELLDTLAAALAANGKFSEAVETAEKAIKIAGSQGNKPLLQELKQHLQLYKADKPYREP